MADENASTDTVTLWHKQQIRELISGRKTSREHNNKTRVAYGSSYMPFE